VDSEPAANDETTAIVPVREQAIDFYGDTLTAALVADGTILVPLRPVVEGLGLVWSGQYERIQRDPVLSEALQFVRVTRTNSAGGDPTVLCLPLKLLPGFLFGLNASRVKPELRERILRYQRECYDVLWNAFKADILPTPAPPTGEIDLSPIEQALALAEAVASLARQQLNLEGRYTTMADYTRSFIQQTRAHQTRTDERLAALELHLSGGATISEDQAAEIAGAVKAVAGRLGEQGIANPYQQVWGELYKRYRVAAYRNLPAARYEEALNWLQGWYTELGPSDK
jgi:hypothetical protein